MEGDDMKKKIFCYMAASIVLVMSILISELSQDHSGALGSEQRRGPYYFMAIHNEPFHQDSGGALMRESYEVLKRMVERANRYNIKLTLMFSPQWVDFLAAECDRLEELGGWKSQGHEIAAHHHSIYHGNWDGYTNYAKETALNERRKHTPKPEEYLGTLADFLLKLRRLNPDIRSGCLNDELDKACLPDEIIYDTGSGFANFGKPGTLFMDVVPEKGRNDFVTKGILRGIEHKWLCHFQTTTVGRQLEAQKVFESMNSGVYGSVNHSSPHEEEAFDKWIDYLHSKDPGGERSRTVSGVIDGGILPEVSLSEAALTKKQSMVATSKPDSELEGLIEKFRRLLAESRTGGADVSRAIELDQKSREAFRERKIDECKRLLREAIQSLK